MSDGATDMMLEEREAARGAILGLFTKNIELFIHKNATPDELISIAQMALTESRRVANERPS